MPISVERVEVYGSHTYEVHVLQFQPETTEGVAGG